MNVSPTRMARIDLRTAELSAAQLRAALPRGGVDVDAVLPTVRPIVDAVAEKGADAALEYGETFDGVRPATVRVPVEDIERALTELAADVRVALEVAIERARAVHADQRRTNTTTTLAPGATVTERWVPVERVGLYVPGGNAVYPSSVVMNVVPAQTAGVDSLVIASPPQAEFGGLPHPTILAAAALLGVNEVWAVGGAQSVALLAYGGTDTDGDRAGARRHDHRPRQHLRHRGQADMPLAGRHRRRGGPHRDRDPGRPHRRSRARRRRLDQPGRARRDGGQCAGHPQPELADATDRELAVQLETTVHRERVTAALTGKQSAIVLVDDLEAGVRTVNAYAAEHLEIQTIDASGVAGRIRSAGAIFVGPYAPVSLGDYCAGSNHVLPTAGCARHSSGLRVQTFLKGIHVVDYDEAALKDVSGYVITLSQAENLPAHGEAVRRRFET